MTATHLRRLLLFFLVGLLSSGNAWAGPSQGPVNKFVSSSDQLLTIRKVGLIPVTDNVNGIYARYVETKLIELLKQTYRFDVVEISKADPKLTNQDYDKNPGLVRKLAEGSGADALVIARVQKFAAGVDLSIGLYLRGDGQLMFQEGVSSDPRFDEKDVQKRTAELFGKLIKRIPYSGLVLSRQGNRVTVDLGSRDGVVKDTILSVEQIISISRHPKFRFLLSSEKEILGKIKLVKVDETLSFGVILSERERGVINANSKIVGLDFVVYENAAPATPAAKTQGPQDQVSFGKNPKEWVPEEKPGFGAFTMMLGLGFMRNSTTLETAGSFSADSGMFPQIDLNGELWMTPTWIFGASIRQGVLGFDNNQAGSTPSRLNASTSRYEAHLGYRFLLQDDFWGPQIKLNLGLAKSTIFVDASTPVTYTTMSYSGLMIGIGGYIPLTPDHLYDLDVNLNRYLLPAFSESPVTSASAADSAVTTFSLGGSYRMSMRFRARVQIEYEMYSVSFSGQGTRSDKGLSASQSVGSVLGGLTYQF